VNLTDPQKRYSSYAVWEEFNRALTTDFEANKSKYSSYFSPIIITCFGWMAKAGDAIKRNDTKTTYHYLWNIAHATMESIQAYDNGLLPGVSEEWMKTYYEFNQAANILLIMTGNRTF
jgi:hypothetical protein